MGRQTCHRAPGRSVPSAHGRRGRVGVATRGRLPRVLGYSRLIGPTPHGHGTGTRAAGHVTRSRTPSSPSPPPPRYSQAQGALVDATRRRAFLRGYACLAKQASITARLYLPTCRPLQREDTRNTSMLPTPTGHWSAANFKKSDDQICELFQ
jgi:hypothetical protein